MDTRKRSKTIIIILIMETIYQELERPTSESEARLKKAFRIKNDYYRITESRELDAQEGEMLGRCIAFIDTELSLLRSHRERLKLAKVEQN